MIGAALGARVIAVDVADAALDRARALGAEAVVDASRNPDPEATIREVTEGGARVSIDALGSPATAVASVRCLGRRGKHIQVGLLLGSASTPPIPMDLSRRSGRSVLPAASASIGGYSWAAIPCEPYISSSRAMTMVSIAWSVSPLRCSPVLYQRHPGRAVGTGTAFHRATSSARPGSSRSIDRSTAEWANAAAPPTRPRPKFKIGVFGSGDTFLTGTPMWFTNRL